MSTAGAGHLGEEFLSDELPTNPSVPPAIPGDLSRVQQISTPDSKAKDTNSIHSENPRLCGEGPYAKDDLDADTSKIDHEAIDRADGDHDEFLRLRAKMQDLKQKAKDIIQVQALKSRIHGVARDVRWSTRLESPRQSGAGYATDIRCVT